MTANTSSNTMAVPQLRDDGANWADYESKAQTAMGARGLIRHCDGTVQKPVTYPEVDGILMKTPGVKAMMKIWKKKNINLMNMSRRNTVCNISCLPLCPCVSLQSSSPCQLYRCGVLSALTL